LAWRLDGKSADYPACSRLLLSGDQTMLKDFLFKDRSRDHWTAHTGRERRVLFCRWRKRDDGTLAADWYVGPKGG
jgi:hypothetical protein